MYNEYSWPNLADGGPLGLLHRTDEIPIPIVGREKCGTTGTGPWTPI